MKPPVLKKEISPALKKAYSILWHLVAYTSITLIAWNTIYVIALCL